jgi:Mn-dependent DtxR family transcriptional regulator
MLTPEERKLLELINEKKLVRRSELQKLIEKADGTSVSMVNNLLEKGLISNVSPLGETSFIVTNVGLNALKSKP